MNITLYEYGPSRSARCRWTLLEAGMEFDSMEGRELVHSPELTAVHPQGKLPAALIDGRPLFESAAISTFVADQVPEAGLIAPTGSYERGLHDQWVCFALTEMEAHLWSTARNSFVYPEDERITAVYQQNERELRRSAEVLERALADADYLVDNRFSVTDIIVGYTVNWARRQGLLDGSPNLQAYLQRLFQRPHCTLNPE